jgi:ABC-type uncharacterized transport system permease subunit
MSDASLVGGLGMQLLWIGIGAAVSMGFWRLAVRHYSAVGN